MPTNIKAIIGPTLEPPSMMAMPEPTITRIGAGSIYPPDIAFQILPKAPPLRSLKNRIPMSRPAIVNDVTFINQADSVGRVKANCR